MRWNINRKAHEMTRDEEMTPYRGSGKRMLSRDDEVEISVVTSLGPVNRLGIREDVKMGWKRAIVCVSDVYKSFGTCFLVQPKDSGEFQVYKYADEGTTWRRPEPAADPIWAKEFHGILRNLCTELGVEFSDSDPRKSANAALEKARWFSKPNTARETDLQHSMDQIAAEAFQPLTGSRDPGAVIERIRELRQSRDDSQRQMILARNIVNRLAGCLGIGNWNFEGDELVAKAGQWQTFEKWLHDFAQQTRRKADDQPYSSPERVAFSCAADHVEMAYNLLAGLPLKATESGLPWYDRNEHG